MDNTQEERAQKQRTEDFFLKLNRDARRPVWWRILRPMIPAMLVGFLVGFFSGELMRFLF